MMITNKKKSTPGEVQIYGQDYGTTPEVKSEAERLFDRINSERPIKRPKSPGVDRAFRQMIEHANRSGDCIINDGRGYFRPGEDDEAAAEEYFAKERHRAREVLRKVRRMEEVFNRRYQ